MKMNRYKLLFLLPLIFLMIVLVMGGYYFGLREGLKVERISQTQLGEKPAAKMITEENLPISLNLLQNPIVYEWRGSVKGVLIEKDEHSFVLEDGNKNRIKITDILPSGETFHSQFIKPSGDSVTKLTLKDIPLGTTLVGDFWIFKTWKDVPVGGTFAVIDMEK